MRKLALLCWILAATVLTAQLALAQGDAKAQDSSKPSESTKPLEPAHYYHLNFIVQELGTDGKAINSRSYTTTIATERHEITSIRTSSKLPIPTGGTSTNEYSYVDLVINIDAHDAHEVGRQLALNLSADVNTFTAAPDPAMHHPATRQNRWQGSVLIPIGKPTVVFASDALESKGATQVMLTATPIQ